MSRLLILFGKYEKILTKRALIGINNSPSINRTDFCIKNLSLTSNNSKNPIATFDEVKSLRNNNQTLLIDVREPKELQETGCIPNSINIPLGDVHNVLKSMPNAEFRKKYGRDKPNAETPIIFSCMIGKRSGQAQEIANKLGYKNVKNYLGSWREWSEKFK